MMHHQLTLVGQLAAYHAAMESTAVPDNLSGGAKAMYRIGLENQRAVLFAMNDGPLTRRELMEVTGLTDNAVDKACQMLEVKDKITRIGKAPAKWRRK